MNEDKVYGRIFKILIGTADEAEPGDKEYGAVQAWAKSTLDLLEMVYPHDIFDGSSGSAGSVAVAEIRRRLEGKTY